MTLQFPITFDDSNPVGGQELQDVLDVIATQFPIGSQNISNSVLLLNTTGTSRKIAFGSGASAASFGGGAQLTTSIAHGLGVTPVWATIQSSEIVSTVGTGPVTVSFQATPWTTTNLQIRARIDDGGTSLNFPTWYWAAIG